MKNISFRVRQFDKETFLTFNIDNDAELDEELLDYLEEEEPQGIVPVIFEEGDEFDTFSYDITDKIRLRELSQQVINSEMVLKVLRGLIVNLMNMSEYRIPLSYLVLNRQYIYIDGDYKVEFVCIPIEDMKEEVDLVHFIRNFIASLRFDPSESGDYVARLLTYINDRETSNLHNLLSLVEDLMRSMDIEIPDDESNEIFVEYTEISEDEQEDDAQEEAMVDEADDEVDEESVEEAIFESDEPEEEESVLESDEEEESVFVSDKAEQSEKDRLVVDPEAAEEYKDTKLPEEEEPAQKEPALALKNKSKKDKPRIKRVINNGEPDELDVFLAEQDRADQMKFHSTVKFAKGLKINRASIIKTNEEELKAAEHDKELEEVKAQEADEKPKVDNAQEAADDDKQKPAAKSVPKVNPYLVRVNTDEKIIINKQTFKLGKASVGADYSIRGNAAISRIHAIITCKDGEYYIKDNKSTNHTFVDGKSLEDNEQVLLTENAKIVLGDEEFIFKL
jgi:hypothetical protein